MRRAPARSVQKASPRQPWPSSAAPVAQRATKSRSIDAQPEFARMMALSLRSALNDRRLTYDEVAALIANLGVVNRFGRAYSGKAIQRAIQDGSVPGYLVAAFCVALDLDSLHMRRF